MCSKVNYQKVNRKSKITLNAYTRSNMQNNYNSVKQTTITYKGEVIFVTL